MVQYSFLQKAFFLAVRFRNSLYDRKILQQVKPCNIPIISVGNLSWGGTGKSEFVRLIGSKLLSSGKSVLIVSRGYRCKFSGNWMEIKQETYNYLNCDEPLMLKKFLPRAIIFIGSKREVVIKEALRRYNLDVCLLDDGFQYRRLKRDLDIVLVFPRQRLLREPLSSLGRADLVVINKAISYEEALSCQKVLRKWTDAPILASKYELDLPSTGTFILVCAIANPEHLYNDIVSRGLKVKAKLFFRDHHCYSYRDVLRMITVAKRNNSFILVTHKDWVKLEKYANVFFRDRIVVNVIGVKINFFWGEEILWKKLEEKVYEDNH